MCPVATVNNSNLGILGKHLAIANPIAEWPGSNVNLRNKREIENLTSLFFSLRNYVIPEENILIVSPTAVTTLETSLQYEINYLTVKRRRVSLNSPIKKIWLSDLKYIQPTCVYLNVKMCLNFFIIIIIYGMFYLNIMINPFRYVKYKLASARHIVSGINHFGNAFPGYARGRAWCEQRCTPLCWRAPEITPLLHFAVPSWDLE